ncbi:ferrochelatase, partial [Priestia megaterium]|uniref:ferrochelatase n=1 Tax=Priestia megaterium TaxID=1404 RepID=UPI001F39B2FC
MEDLRREVDEEKGYRWLVYSRVGFMGEDLEVVYDNEYEWKVVRDEIGGDYYRGEMRNAEAEFMDGLAT